MKFNIPQTFSQLLLPIAIAGVMLLSGMPTKGQHLILDNFSAFQHDEEVYLSWIIGRGNTCNGITIERSTDNLSFVEVGNIAGVCGSPDFAQSYSWTDEHPVKNKVNYYRLELGLQGYSDVRSVEYIYVGADGFQLRPNPVVDHSLLLFNNRQGHLHRLEIYSVGGGLIEQKESNSNEFNISAAEMQAGVYLLQLTNTQTGKVSSGKVIVAGR